MNHIEYKLGRVESIRALYPPARFANPDVGLSTYRDVIRHYTMNSLMADGFQHIEVHVLREHDAYHVRIGAKDSAERLQAFADRHVLLFSATVGGKAVAGMKLMQALGVWNPMSGYPVNDNPNDGECKWNLFPPLGLNVIGQRGVQLMHYPPWQVLQQATFLQVMTMHRWSLVLQAVGIPKEDVRFYRNFVDVNPIAAPGSGQSEYPNDYLPIMAASAFFHGPEERDYIRSMLEVQLAPPGGGGKRYTLPLLICGSALYDPQAPGWFRTTYKDLLPKDSIGTPMIEVLQAGSIKIRPDSTRETPFLGANHMIAAGVTGRCTPDPSKMPDIRLYNAQDLVAASFLYAYADNPDLDPLEAKRQACQRWFGNAEGSGVPNPPAAQDKQILCALAQTDLFFDSKKIQPQYSWEQAMERCAKANNDCNPCCSPIGPSNLESGCGKST